MQVKRKFSKSTKLKKSKDDTGLETRKQLLQKWKERQERLAEDLMEIEEEEEPPETMALNDTNNQQQITMKSDGKYSTGIFPQVTRV